MLSTYALFAASVFASGVPIFVNLDPPKSTSPLVPAAPGFTVITVLSPFLMTRSFVPLPEIPFMPVKVSANFTTKPFASVVGSFSTRMLTPAVASAAGVKFSAPFTVNSVPNARLTCFASSPVKVNGCVAIPFTVLIRVSNLETAAPTLLTVSVPPAASSFVMLYVGCVNAPLVSTPALPPRAVANSCLAVYN